MIRLSSAGYFFSGRVLIGLGLLFLLCGCDVDYYWHLAAGQARIVLNCEPIDELLARADLDSTRRERLLLIQSIRRYGFDHMGLEESSSYTRFYDTQDQPVSWNVSASPPDRFAPYLWRFPIAGTVPYKGFFDRDRAAQERDGLQNLGHDVLLRPVSAYSTLGYFSDPVLSSMLDYPVDSLADLILHELTHGTIYIKGHTDFNESLATFVGRTGSLEFIAFRFGPDSPLIAQAQQRRKDAARFREFMNEVVASLDSLYQLGLDRDTVLVERREVFQQAKERFRSIRSDFLLLNYDGFLRWEVNNARLLSYRRYHYNLDQFAAVYASKGKHLDQALQVYKSCEDAQDPWVCLDDSIRTACQPSLF